MNRQYSPDETHPLIGDLVKSQHDDPEGALIEVRQLLVPGMSLKKISCWCLLFRHVISLVLLFLSSSLLQRRNMHEKATACR